MKGARKFIAIGAVFLFGFIIWNFKVNGQTADLMLIAQPFLTACNSNSGCILSPPGWELTQEAYRLDDGGEWTKSSDTASFEGKMEYVANRRSFELRWHVSTDVYLVARGSAGGKLVITRVVN